MGVRVYDTEEEEQLVGSSTSDQSASASGKCHNCGAAAGEHHVKLPTVSAHKTTGKSGNATPHHVAKDLVGNGKEYRIDGVNRYDLRIIGNGNRVRIAQNVGSVQIIGNATRLKINANSGGIKYTGNDGRICLGTDSTQQCVDYTGCNGILKICSSTEWPTMNLTKKLHKHQRKSDEAAAAAKAGRGCTAGGTDGNASSKSSATPILIPKSASYAGADWAQQYEWMMNATGACGGAHAFHTRNDSKKQHISLPNLGRSSKDFLAYGGQPAKKQCRCSCKCGAGAENEPNYANVRVVHNTIGSIVIKNAVNVTI